jgi:hypothetical protein
MHGYKSKDTWLDVGPSTDAHAHEADVNLGMVADIIFTTVPYIHYLFRNSF